MEIYVLNIKNILSDKINYVKSRFPMRFLMAQQLKRNRKAYLRSIGGSYLIARLFPEVSEDDLFYGTYGKPFILTGEFNVSHISDLVVLVKDDSPVGVNAMRLNKIRSKPLFKGLSESEREIVGTDVDKLYKVLSIKKSFLKLIGYGDCKPFEEFDVSSLYNNEPIYQNGLTTYSFNMRKGNYFFAISTYKDLKSAKVIEIK